MSESFDAAVVGGSAIGGVCASYCAKNGIKTVILEEDSIVGKFRRCTSICSESGLRSVGIPFSDSILNYIEGAVIHSPSEEFMLRMKGKKAIVFDRQIFDENCITSAVSNGAELRLDNRIVSFGKNSLSTGKRSINAQVIIGADGASSSTAVAYQFPSINRFVYCFESEITNVDVAHPDIVDVFFDNQMLSGFFGWIVPVDERTARVGFGIDNPLKLLMAKKHFFNKIETIQYSSGKSIRDFNAAIPVCVRKSTQQGNVLLVGDAAGQTKATTGGGLVFGSLCAKSAAESVSLHISDENPIDYEKRWRSKYGLSLYLHGAIRNIANRMDNSILNTLASLGKNPLPAYLLSRFGDMDFVFRF